MGLTCADFCAILLSFFGRMPARSPPGSEQEADFRTLILQDWGSLFL